MTVRTASPQQQSRAMEPTYPEGSDVTVRPVDGSGVRRSDVVLFSARDWGADSVFMMRVIGVGGDHVVIDETGSPRPSGAAASDLHREPGAPPAAEGGQAGREHRPANEEAGPGPWRTRPRAVRRGVSSPRPRHRWWPGPVPCGRRPSCSGRGR
ncbi:S24 family peptidase [Streptomyces sp. F001]|uniref:S26 family signal peptidase n=1 Tax=Streptomyces sp. F001 TaxID=1510026 RepID=UPI00101E67AE|nr:S26 family signal peptidase [Streptomyces sp. F001]RZB15111.1 S24 family peptidase [Streptomyces sp. F001]